MRRRWLSKFASGSTCIAMFIRGTQHGDARFATASLPDQHVDALQKTCRFNYAELRDLRRALYSRQTHGDFGINHGSATAYEISTGSPKIGDGRGSMTHLRFRSS